MNTLAPVTMQVGAGDEDEVHVLLTPAGLIENLIVTMARNRDLADVFTHAIGTARKLAVGNLSANCRTVYDGQLQASIRELDESTDMHAALTAVITEPQAVDLIDRVRDALSDLDGQTSYRNGLNDEPEGR